MLEVLKQELYKCIELYGNLDPKTVAKSQELDLLIVREMKSRTS